MGGCFAGCCCCRDGGLCLGAIRRISKRQTFFVGYVYKNTKACVLGHPELKDKNTNTNLEALLLSESFLALLLCDSPAPRPPPSPPASIRTMVNIRIQKIRGVTPQTRLCSRSGLPWVYGIFSSDAGRLYASGAFGGTTSRSAAPLYLLLKP